MTNEPTHSSAPIDAEFEPADSAEKPSIAYEKPAKSGGGPGWISLTFVALIALGSFGFSLWSSGLLTQTNLPSPTETGLASLRDSQTELQTRVGELASQVEGTIDRVNGEIARLETDIASIEPAPAETVELPEDVTAFEARLSGLEEQIASLTEAQSTAVNPARIDAIETALQSARNAGGGASNAQLVSLQTELETLRADLTALQESQTALTTELDAARSDAQEIGQTSARIISASLALDAIEAASARGEAFQAEYAQLAEIRPNDADVRALASLSRIAIPTPGQLRSNFRQLRNEALARDTEESSGLGWVNTVFGESVSVRRTDAEGETAMHLTDAEAALARDDLKVAIDAIEALPETSKPVFQTWLADARRRARLEDSLEDLRLKLISAGQ
ncbi:MAG: hypothetical protein RLN72_09375 [Henriciella sp.]